MESGCPNALNYMAAQSKRSKDWLSATWLAYVMLPQKNWYVNIISNNSQTYLSLKDHNYGYVWKSVLSTHHTIQYQYPIMFKAFFVVTRVTTDHREVSLAPSTSQTLHAVQQGKVC